MSRPLHSRSSRVKTTKCAATGKRRYRSEIDAKIAKMGMSSERSLKAERRVYECRACRGFHTTSQTVEEYKADQIAKKRARELRAGE